MTSVAPASPGTTRPIESSSHYRAMPDLGRHDAVAGLRARGDVAGVPCPRAQMLDGRGT